MLAATQTELVILEEEKGGRCSQLFYSLRLYEAFGEVTVHKPDICKVAVISRGTLQHYSVRIFKWRVRVCELEIPCEYH